MRERPRDDKGSYRIMSAVDLEATFRKHEPDPAVLGSNAMIATTATRIRAAVVATGSTPDQDAPVAVLRQQLAAQQPLPPALIMDQAGGMGKTRAQVDAVSDGQTQMVAQVPHTGVAGPTRFTPADFRISADGHDLYLSQWRAARTHRYQHSRVDGLEFSVLRRRSAGAARCGRHAADRTVARPASARSTARRIIGHLRAGAAFNATAEGTACCAAAGRWSRRLHGWCATTAAGRRGGSDWRRRSASCSRRARCATCNSGSAALTVGQHPCRQRSRSPSGTTTRRWRWLRNGVAARDPPEPRPAPSRRAPRAAVRACSRYPDHPRRMNPNRENTSNCCQGPCDPNSAKLS